MEDDCISCKDGNPVTQVYGDGTGTCDGEFMKCGSDMWDYFAIPYSQDGGSGYMFEANIPPQLYDPITGATNTIATFATLSYNGEFEALFPDLTINRDVIS